jgi:hypothetical protein
MIGRCLPCKHRPYVKQQNGNLPAACDVYELFGKREGRQNQRVSAGGGGDDDAPP